MKPILVTSYINPDLDGVACALAYGEFLQKTGRLAEVGVLGEPHIEAQYVLDRFGIEPPLKIENDADFDKVILVDTCYEGSVLGKVTPIKVIEIIDHHLAGGEEKFTQAKIQIEAVGAAATLVAERFIQNQVEMSKESAILLFGAIISNTLNFKGRVATDRDKVAAAWLNQTAQLPQDFWKDLFAAKSDLSGSRLAEGLRGDFAISGIELKKVGIAQLEIIGAQKLITERRDEIIKVLAGIKQEKDLDIVFLNIIDLEEDQNFFIAQDLVTQKLLEKILDIEFNEVVAVRPNLIMRKQIVPLLKQEIDGR